MERLGCLPGVVSWLWSWSKGAHFLTFTTEVNQWDLHAFGVWLADDVRQWAGWDAPRTIELIYR